MCKNEGGTRSSPGIGSKAIFESPLETSAIDMAQSDSLFLPNSDRNYFIKSVAVLSYPRKLIHDSSGQLNVV